MIVVNKALYLNSTVFKSGEIKMAEMHGSISEQNTKQIKWKMSKTGVCIKWLEHFYLIEN